MRRLIIAVLLLLPACDKPRDEYKEDAQICAEKCRLRGAQAVAVCYGHCSFCTCVYQISPGSPSK